MERNRIKSVINSLLFVAEKPLSTPRIVDVFNDDNDVNTDVVTEILHEMTTEYATDDRLGFILNEVADGWQLRTRDDNNTWVKKLESIKPIRISPSALEALAIIAYKQPVIKAEVDKIRGVDSSHLVKALMERNLVKISGRADLPGKPLLYSTTPEFLEIFGLKDIKDLPSLTEIEELAARTGNTGDFKELNNSLRLIVEETPSIDMVADDDLDANMEVLDEMEELNKELRIDIDLVQEKVDIIFEEACRKYSNQRQRNHETTTGSSADASNRSGE
jgi:segregation and condensation protein B